MTIYDKPTTYGVNKTLILQPKEAYFIETGIDDYTDFVLGVQWGFTSLLADNANLASSTSQTLSNTIANNFYFGLIDNVDGIPSASNNYIGMRGERYNRYQPDSSESHSVSPSSAFRTAIGGCSIIGGVTTSGTTQNNGSNLLRMGSTRDYQSSGFCLRFRVSLQVNNKGLSNQTITLRMTPLYASGQNGLLSETLGIFDTTDTQYTIGTFNWNDGVSARPLPKNIIIYCPFDIVRLRIHNCIYRVS